MKRMICEICGGSLIKKSGFFECESCGTKYTLEEAKLLFGNENDKYNNSSSEEELLKLAEKEYSKNYKKCETICDEIIDKNKYCVRAWALKAAMANIIGRLVLYCMKN